MKTRKISKTCHHTIDIVPHCKKEERLTDIGNVPLDGAGQVKEKAVPLEDHEGTAGLVGTALAAENVGEEALSSFG